MTAINIRMDDDLKAAFASVCNQIGMSVSTAITIFAKKMVAENGMPFEVKADPFYSEENMARLRKSIAQAESGKHTVHELVECNKKSATKCKTHYHK